MFTSLFMGLELPSIDFFVPTNEFIEYVAKTFPGGIIEAGAGKGLFASKLIKKGIRVTPIDIGIRENPHTEIYELDAVSFHYPENSIVFVCRPSHGYFPDALFRKVLTSNCRLFYVGLSKNIEVDIDEDVYYYQLIMSNIGEEGEIMLEIFKR